MAKKKKIHYLVRLTKLQTVICGVVLLALLTGSFLIGRSAGVSSMAYHGDILLVNASHKLKRSYQPEALVNLYKNRHSFRLASTDIYLTRECYEAAQAMFAAAEAENVNGFVITSGYRSYDRQKEVYKEAAKGTAQKPGASEHQTGLAFDVAAESGTDGFESTEQYAWLCKHAHEYGFIQRYPANKANETGISYEPWHYRYVGVEAATMMKQTGQTLEAFLGKI